MNEKNTPPPARPSPPKIFTDDNGDRYEITYDKKGCAVIWELGPGPGFF